MWSWSKREPAPLGVESGGTFAGLLLVDGEGDVAVARMPFIVIGQVPFPWGAKIAFSKPHLYDRTRAMLYAIRKGLTKVE
jgi:hypothetical protein